MKMPVGALVVVIKEQDEFVRPPKMYRLAETSDTDNPKGLLGYELNASMEPTGAKHRLKPENIVIMDRAARRKAIEEDILFIEEELAKQKRKIDALARYDTDEDEMVAEIKSIHDSDMPKDARREAIRSILKNYWG